MYEKWEKLKVIRNVVNAGIEVKRSSKDIGSSLETDIEIYLGKEYLEFVKDINLSEYFITSKAQVKTMTNDNKIFKLDDISNVGVLVTKAKGKKCSRCWKILEKPCQRICIDYVKYWFIIYRPTIYGNYGCWSSDNYYRDYWCILSKGNQK